MDPRRSLRSIDLLHLLHRGELSHSLPRFPEEFAERLGPVFDEIMRRDRNARRTAPFHKRHRLPVLLQVLEEWERRDRARLPLSPFAALGEVAATLELLRAWKADPHWPKLVPGLKSETNYAHTVVLLGLAKHIRDAGVEVVIQPETSLGPICDLAIRHTGRVPVNVELKVPSELHWQRVPLLPSAAARHITKQFNRAGTGPTGQLPPGTSAVLAIGGLSFLPRTRDLLQAAANQHFERPPGDYSHVMGVLFVWIGTEMRVANAQVAGTQFGLDSALFARTEVQFVHNPLYEGQVRWSVSG